MAIAPQYLVKRFIAEVKDNPALYALAMKMDDLLSNEQRLELLKEMRRVLPDLDWPKIYGSMPTDHDREQNEPY